MLLKQFSGWLENNRNTIFIVCIVVIIVFFALITVINIFIKKYRFNKSVKEFEKKYEYYRALLVGQDSSNLKRIYSISNYNLLYTEIYNGLLKKYEYLLQTYDEQAQNSLKMLKDCLDKSKSKANKENIKRNREILIDYYKQVEDFSKELKDLLKNEEDAQTKALNQKEELRIIKNSYFEHESELKLVDDSFELLFSNIDEAFKRFSEQIDCANYEEVDKILSRVDMAIKELKPVIDELPILCARVSNVIPNKIASLKLKYQEMIDDGYPLNHLHVNSCIEEFELTLNDVVERLKAFNLVNCDQDLENILEKINVLIDKFEEEKVAKEEFESSVNDVYKSVKSLEDKTVKVCNIIPEVRKDYLIMDKYVNEIDVIKFNVSRLGTIKRTLDNYIHSSIKQPYSVLRNKCNELNEETKIANKKLSELSNYLLSLENDFNSANDVIYNGYFELKDSFKIVHEIFIPEYEKKQEQSFARAFKLIDDINATLKVRPVDIARINQMVLDFVNYKDELIKMIDKDNSFVTLTESLVVYANKERHHLSDIKTLLSQVETSFFDGEFERSYLDAGNATKKLKSASNIKE